MSEISSDGEEKRQDGETEVDAETAKTAGRGFLIITAAKVWFLITSAVIQLGLPILISPEQFGIFKIVTEWVGWINMVMITGTLHAVSKLISEQPERARVIVNMAVKMQCMLAVPIAILYALGSPLIAEHWYDAAETLAPLMQLSALIILFYGFYAIFVGYFNGLKQFTRQATLDFTFSTVKLLGIVGLVLLGFGVWGAVAGFVAAAGVIFTVATIWVVIRMRKRTDQTTPEDEDEAKAAFRRLLSYLVLIMLYTFALNGLMRIDMLVLPGVASNIPPHLQGMETDLFELMSNIFAGVYGASLNIARIPYQGVIAVTFVIFPLISEATFHQDRERTREYIHSTLRYCVIMIGVGAMLLAFNADAIVGGLYAEVYGHASVALAILSVAIIFFALLYVTATMIIGSGHPKVAFGIMAISLGISAVLNYVFVNRVHRRALEDMEPVTPPQALEGEATAIVAGAVDTASAHADFAGPWLAESTTYMQWAATATLIAMATGFVLSLVWLWLKFDAPPPWMTLLRMGLVAVVLWGIDLLIELPVEMVAEYGNIPFLGLVVGKMTIMGVVALVVLFAAREFQATDWERLRAVIGRGSDETSSEEKDGVDDES